MTPIRSLITLACLAALTATAGAQGITDIMRGNQRLGPAPLPSQPRPAAVPTRQSAEYIVALVNSEPVTNNEVQSRMQRLLRESPEAQRMPRAELARLVLERIINERAQLQLGRENGVKVDDLAVDQAEQTVARQNQISVAELRRRVAAEGMSQDQFRRELGDQLILTRLRDREIEA